MYNPFKILKIKQGEWKMKSPKQKWQTFYGFGDWMCKLIGIHIYDDLNNYWYSYSPALLTFIHFLLTIYTIQLHAKDGDILREMECTCVIGIVVTVS